MKYPLLKGIKKLSILSLFAGVLVLTSCKKETVEVSVDAFAQLNNELKYEQGVYNVLFSLQEYPYKEIGVRVGNTKSSIHQNKDLTYYIANQVSANRYGIFLNALTRDKIYYYQIYVKDSASEKVVYSDIFSFKTNP
ncbi:hypothetical protein H9X96_13725 [Pedobacter sp. N36a]|uniref:hypothetical protein n=1 Tax=Pedobacter sp. N36a TaxID=2767996 RepID=UPI001656CE94|nr:hypothetical protein [Pedobacter sp. N36a]MBC8986832.1 hypothetical protein [Pedobacter sp. N36a]